MAKDSVKDTKEENRLTIVQLRGSDIKLLIPEGYRKLNYKNPVRKLASEIINDMIPFQKIVESSNQVIMFTKADKKNVMDFDDLDGLIKGIHESMTDEQGLIEAKKGITSRGYKYIYSIVKTVDTKTMGGAKYFLRLNIGTDDDVLEVQGDFQEIGTTGTRDTLGMEFARRAGLTNMIGDNPFEGWSEDPFDKTYTKGILMNLSEKEGIDALFPYHPLTQAREFLLAVLYDKFVIIKKEDSEESKESSDANKEETKEKQDEKEFMKKLFVDECQRITYDVDVNEELEKDLKVDIQLKNAIDQYNIQYVEFNEAGTKLMFQREKASELITYIESLINSIANHPKTFDTDFDEIKANKATFKEAIEYANEELDAAKKSAAGSGAGIAAGTAVASMAPTAAMWIATTFGTASTGTAISTLSGAAATNAALAWLGGGAAAAGGGGMAAGHALLALAGPVGWGIAGASILTSVILFARKKIKLAEEKNKELTDVKTNTAAIKEATAKINQLKDEHMSLYEKLNISFLKGMKYANSDYCNLKEDEQLELGTLVNNTKSLSALLKKNVE